MWTAPGRGASGSGTRSGGENSAAAATWPSRSTTSAGPLTRASTGAATTRSRSVRALWALAARALASCATEATSAIVLGCAVLAGPVTLTSPSRLPSAGSSSGAAVHTSE